ncbi:right-handed parallel beta-helix repeat-containing protein [Danxiaibacter flavus]|uniref:Right-handed parallel beta-helix repeat-containing protein n=1 Tax=Danxiaibacter flavus TaxID=3049108 RepID=A0ABV3ZBQ1_9BACT|nr:right-handed parallel beta-helix repeat-containing protein [Chitinophagaceae bacterium DXS]
MRLLTLVIAIGLFPFLLNAQVIDVTGFGVRPDSYEDATQGVQRAIEACRNKPGAVLSFPKGRYDFWPTKAQQRNYYISNTSSEEECPSKIKNIGLLFENMQDLTIEGNGSVFMFHGKMITWALDHCDKIRLQNIHVDFERPSMSEMTFKEVNDTVIIAAIHPDSKFDIRNDTLTWYGEEWRTNHFHAILVDDEKGMETYSSWGPFLKSKATIIAPFTVKFSGDFSKNKFAKGQVLTVRDPVRDHVGAFINQSKNINLYNVNMHYMHGLGIVAQFSENLHYDSVTVAPTEKSGRMIAAFADGAHFSGCKGDILLERCHFKGLHDDPVNVHGTHLQITKIINPTSVIVRFMHPQTYGMEAFFKSDSVALVHSPSLQIYGYNIVTNAKLISEKEMKVDLSGPLTAATKIGDCLENITCTPNLTVRNCRFERTNTRGLLVTTRGKVVIENNVFFRTGMHAILIANDATSWFESGPVQDVLIRNNTFEDCGYNSGEGNYTIAIAPENHQPADKYWVHKNIRIENNTFKVYDYPVLTARSTNGLSFVNNTILNTGFLPAKAHRASIVTNACTNVNIKANRFEWPQDPVINRQNMKASDLHSDIK